MKTSLGLWFEFCFLVIKAIWMQLQSQPSHSVVKLNDNITCRFALMSVMTSMMWNYGALMYAYLHTIHKLVQLMNRVTSTFFMPNHSHNMDAFHSSFWWNLGWVHCKTNHWQQLTGPKKSGCNTPGTNIMWFTN